MVQVTLYSMVSPPLVDDVFELHDVPEWLKLRAVLLAPEEDRGRADARLAQPRGLFLVQRSVAVGEDDGRVVAAFEAGGGDAVEVSLCAIPVVVTRPARSVYKWTPSTLLRKRRMVVRYPVRLLSTPMIWGRC